MVGVTTAVLRSVSNGRLRALTVIGITFKGIFRPFAQVFGEGQSRRVECRSRRRETTRTLRTMPGISTHIVHIADPKFRSEKPFFIIPIQGGSINPETDQVTNLHYESKPVAVTDMGERPNPPTIHDNGFTLLARHRRFLEHHDMESVQQYKLEVQEHLRIVFPDAEEVLTWDFRMRR